MGNHCVKSADDGSGKKKDKNGEKHQPKNENTGVPTEKELEELDQIGESAYEDNEEMEYQRIRDSLHNDLQMFVINNVLMSVQFFKNFDEEIEELRKEAWNNEGQLIEGERIRLFLTDKIIDKIGTRVLHKPQHGPQKHKEGLLQPIKGFLAFENVEVDEKVNRELKKIKKQPPFYNLAIESPNPTELAESGYVNLREVAKQEEEIIYASIEDGDESSSSATRSDGDDSDLEGLADRLRQNRFLTVKTDISAQNDYGYTTIQNLTATKHLHEARRGHIPSSACVLTPYCFAKVEKPQPFNKARRTGHMGPLMTTVTYVNSQHFFTHFLDVFEERLLDCLHLTQGISSAMVQGSRIVAATGLATHHLSPVFNVNWWPDCSFSFMKPEQGDIAWPTRRLQKKIQKMGTFLMPLGFLKRRGDNPDYQLQWRFVNPRGEEILLLHTMHSHIRCYLFTLAVYKSFFANEETCLAVDSSHILHLLFWEVKKDFLSWPEDRPGENLINFLRTLYKAVESRKIRDFFIHERNLLQSCPFIFLNRVQGMLKKIIENPLPYVIQSVKNLRIRSPAPFPELDYNRVYKLVTVKDILLYLYPNLQPQKKERKTNINIDGRDFIRSWQQLRFQELKENEKAEKAKETMRLSIETIQFEEEVTKDDDSERRIELLRTFTPHFIAMARNSIDYKAFDQALAYLHHATRLTRLLQEERVEEHDVAEFHDSIERVRKRCEKEKEQANDVVDKKEGATTSADNKKELRLSIHDRQLPQLPT